MVLTKQTLCFSTPVYLSAMDSKLVIKTGEMETTRSIDDLGVVMLDNSRITITKTAIALLLKNKIAIITTKEFVNWNVW
jgi:CRISPR-associated protein Cas1